MKMNDPDIQEADFEAETNDLPDVQDNQENHDAVNSCVQVNLENEQENSLVSKKRKRENDRSSNHQGMYFTW